jgi:hypothetical protein
MKILLIVVAVALAVIGTAVFSACGDRNCLGTGKLRFLQLHDDIPDPSIQYQQLLEDARFAKVDTFGVSGFIDSREECSNYKRAAESLSLLRNNINDVRSKESKIEAIMIYLEARRHGCNID